MIDLVNTINGRDLESFLDHVFLSSIFIFNYHAIEDSNQKKLDISLLHLLKSK
jgi:hypothetical protein